MKHLSHSPSPEHRWVRLSDTITPGVHSGLLAIFRCHFHPYLNRAVCLEEGHRFTRDLFQVLLAPLAQAIVVSSH